VPSRPNQLSFRPRLCTYTVVDLWTRLPWHISQTIPATISADKEFISVVVPLYYSPPNGRVSRVRVICRRVGVGDFTLKMFLDRPLENICHYSSVLGTIISDCTSVIISNIFKIYFESPVNRFVS